MLGARRSLWKGQRLHFLLRRVTGLFPALRWPGMITCRTRRPPCLSVSRQSWGVASILILPISRPQVALGVLETAGRRVGGGEEIKGKTIKAKEMPLFNPTSQYR